MNNVFTIKKDRNMSVHQAFVATTRDSPFQGDAKGNTNNKGNHNNRSKGRCGRNNNRSNNKSASFQNAPTQPYSSKSVPAGTVLCSAVASLFSTSCISTPVINHPFVGTNLFEGILRSRPNIVC